MGLFSYDEYIEEAMIKSCLLYNKKEIKEKRNSLFHKTILSLIISGKVNTLTEIKEYFDKHHKTLFIDENRIQSAIKELVNNRFIELKDERIILTSDTQQEGENHIRSITKLQKILIDEILEKIKSEYKKEIKNPQQIKSNIKNCISYYYTVSGLSFFELDTQKKMEDLPTIESIASKNISSEEQRELSNIIIYSIGSIIEKPTESQQNILEILARMYITTQIMNIDPLLKNFKGSIIKDKEFILDTDVVLYLITRNASLSEQYRIIIQQLLSCGCKIYIPQDVIREVFNHAEAATKRYYYVSDFLDSDDVIIRQNLKNIFIEDFYFTKHKEQSNGLNWETYIGNFYNPIYGTALILEQIKMILGKNIKYNSMPFDVEINQEEFNLLEEKALEETNKTEKALHREENKNEDIAKTDTMLYLKIKKLNEINNKRIGENDRADLLINKYYILTNSLRIHYCAKSLNLNANVLCKPQSLMAYLSETGSNNTSEIRITSLFDNIFLLHTSKLVWEDIKTLVNSGIDIKGKNLVRLRFDLQEDIKDLLTCETVEDYNGIYERVNRKGYKFEDKIEDIMRDSQNKTKIIESMMQIIEQKNSEIKERDEQIEKAKKIIERKKYEDRINRRRK